MKLIIALALLLLLTACTSQPALSPTPGQATLPAATAIVPSPKAEKPAAAEWDSLVAEAKKEGQVIFLSTLPPSARQALAEGLKAKYGIDIEWVTGRGSELAEKLRVQRQAGLYQADLFMAGSEVPATSLKPGGYLDPIDKLLVLPEVADVKSWYGGQLNWVDKEKRYVFINSLYPGQTLAVNTEMVKPGDIKSWRDILDPKWKGKIVINDPTAPGNGARWFGVVGTVIMGLDFMRELAKQEPVFSRDQRLPVEWVARGKNAIVLGPQVPTVTEFRKAGAPIGWVVPSEGTYLSGGSTSLSLINQAAHPKAAQVFINWLLTKEGATILARETLFQSARLDVPTDFLSPEETRDPNQKYFVGEDEDFLVKQVDHMRTAKDIFGEAMK